MRPSHLITFEQASSRLGIDESALDELIDSGALTTQPWLGDVYLLVDQVTACAANPSASPKPAAAPARVPDEPRIRRIRDLLDSGVREVRAAQARDLLGIGQTQMCKIAREGRVNYEERRNRRWYLLEDIETYARLQDVWASKTGGWSAYGKRDEQSRDQDMVLVAPAREHARRMSVGEQDVEDYPLSTGQVLAVLNVGYSRLRKIVTRGTLTAVYESKPFGRVDTLGRPVLRRSPSFSGREVYALADARENQRSQAGYAAAQWNERMVKPFIRTQIAAPANDVLLTRAEAGVVLGISATGVSNLVVRGRLFGWQEEPGKPGSRLYLSGRQVARYRDDPDRVKRQAAAKRGPRLPSAPGQETAGELWLEETGMAASLRYAKKSNMDRQHGDFLNSQQAAKLLGITPKTLLAMRQRGRIAGYQKPRIKRDGGGHKWWFFRRADVEALLVDRDYLGNRDRGRAAKLQSLGRWIPDAEPSW